MKRRPVIFVAAGLTVVLAMALAATAYATGNMPYRLTSTSMVTPAWEKKRCGGPELGRPSKCPNPGSGSVTDLPRGNGSMVALGDSFSAGEGAPVDDVYEKATRSVATRVLGTLSSSCNLLALGGCLLTYQHLSSEVWLGASGFYPNTDVVGGNTCHRSPEAYGVKVAAALRLTLDFRACSGAVTGDYFHPQNTFTPAQWDKAFPTDTRLVTVGFGGNNVHFSDLVTACITSSTSVQGTIKSLRQATQYDKIVAPLRVLHPRAWSSSSPSSCTPLAQELLKQADEDLGTDPKRISDPSSIHGVLRDVRARAPKDAKVIAVGYPHMFPEGNTKACGAGTGEAILGRSEQAAIDALVDKLNASIEAGATAEGVDYVDMADAFVAPGAAAGSPQDHGLCQGQGPDDKPGNAERWINRFRVANAFTKTEAMKGSMHPDAAGQSNYALHVLACYRSRSACSNFLDTYDWKTPTLAANTCLSESEWVARFGQATWDEVEVQPRLMDVTGDGTDDVVVESQCPSAAASNPTTFTVFDVTGPAPEVIGVLGKEHYYRDATLTVDQADVVVSGTSIGPDDPYCCANSRARDVYRWKTTSFVNTSSSEGARQAPSPSGGGSTSTILTCTGGHGGPSALADARTQNLSTAVVRHLNRSEKIAGNQGAGAAVAKIDGPTYNSSLPVAGSTKKVTPKNGSFVSFHIHMVLTSAADDVSFKDSMVYVGGGVTEYLPQNVTTENLGHPEKGHVFDGWITFDMPRTCHAEFLLVPFDDDNAGKYKF